MATRLALRPHQQECLEHAKAKNTIVCLPTGEGKTLIAARLIEHYLEQYPDKRIAFLVPTRPLVEQQSRYCMNHCHVDDDTPVVQKLFGDEQAGWQQQEWNYAIERCHIFLGTPASFQKALVTDKYICVDQFSLFVFDECHNAKGNSPMAAVLRDAISPHVIAPSTGAPRILGLTASIIHGSLKNMEQDRRVLEQLMNSTVICPDVATKLELKNYHRITYSQHPSHEKHKDMIEMHVKDSLERTSLIKSVKKVVLRCTHVFCELGSHSMFYYIENVIVQQIQAKATHLELQDDMNCERAARGLRACLPNLRNDVKQLSEALSSAIPNMTHMIRTPKLNRLLELLDTNFANSDDDGYKGIIFVEQVALVSALAKQINDEFDSRFRCGAIAGTGAQSEADRHEQLEAFRDGQLKILVATPTLEEGIDVTECKFVVRYNHIATTKAHIQGAGRARHSEAEIYYFENCPENERRKEAAMSDVARNESLALTQEELQKANAEMRISVDQCHPYPFGPSTNTEGEVNVFNCKQLLVNYCSRVLGQSINPEVELYEYFEDTSVLSGEKLSTIRYPTPEGWQKITCLDYKTFWSGVDMRKHIFYSDRAKNKTQPEREEMCFVYLVVVELREKGLLDKHNKPTEVSGFETKRKCPLRGERPPSRVSLKDSIVQSAMGIKRTFDGDRDARELPTNLEESMDERNFTQSLYPFTGENGATVSFSTCKSTLNEYITMVLGKTLPFKDELFEYENRGQRKVLVEVRFPSPTGWLYIRRADYDSFCSEVDVDEIAGPGRKEKWKEEMTFLYLAVVELRKRGHLNAQNKASVDAAARHATQEYCPLRTASPPGNAAAAVDTAAAGKKRTIPSDIVAGKGSPDPSELSIPHE